MSNRPDLFRPLDPEQNQTTTDRETLDALLSAVNECKSLITKQNTATEQATGRYLEALQPSLDAISGHAARIEASAKTEAESRAELANAVREMTAAEQATSRRLEAMKPTLDTISDLADRLAATSDRDDPALAEKRPDDTRTLDPLEARTKALQELQPAVDKLTEAVKASQAETARLRQALDEPERARRSLQALDAWRDDFTRHVTALLARAEKHTVTPADESTLAHVDRGGARAVMLASEYKEAMAKVVTAFEAVTTALEKHGESLRRTENSSLQTRKAADFMRMEFDRSRKEYRRWRHFWVSPLVIFLAIVAGMLLESRAFIIYKLFQ